MNAPRPSPFFTNHVFLGTRLISHYPTLWCLSLLLQNEGEEGKTEYRVWNPFRSKLAAAILGGVDKIHIKPGSKVLYLGVASGTTVSHVADIVGPVSALSPCVCKNVATYPSYLILQFISVSNSLHSPHYHFIPSPLTPSPLTPSPLTPSPLTPSPLTPSPLTPSPFTLSSLYPITTPSPLTPSALHPITTHQSPFTLIPSALHSIIIHHSTISSNHSSPSTHSLTGGSGVRCGVLSPLREGPDQRSQEEDQHYSHHRGRQTPTQVQDAGR